MVLHALTKTGKYLLYLMAAFLILIALLAAMVRLAVFYGEDYSEELASVVGRYIGSPVQISKIDLVWNRFDASASLTDVRILTEDSQETLLVLPLIELELNVRDMLMRRHLSARSVKLSDISLVASYEGRGQIKMHGYEISRRAEGPSDEVSVGTNGAAAERNAEDAESRKKPRLKTGHNALSWLFNADRIAILNSDITLIDSTRDKEYKMDRVNIRAFNSGNLHQIRVSSALPDAHGQISQASFDFTGRANNIDEWSGQFHMDARSVNLSEVSGAWREERQKYSGRADLQLWGRWNGTRVNKVRAVLSGKNLRVQLPATLDRTEASLVAKTTELDVRWSRIAGGWEAMVNRGEIDFADQKLLLTGLDLHLQRESDGYRHIKMAGPDLSVEDLQPLHRFIIDAGLDKFAVGERFLSGSVTGWLVSGRIVDSVFEPETFKADVEELHIEPHKQLPGIQNLSAKIYFSGGVGQLEFRKQQFNLLAPQLFGAEFPALDIEGMVRFRGGKDDWIMAARDLRLESVDIAMSHDFSLQGNGQGQTLIDLNTSIEHVNLPRLKHYYPVQKIKPRLLQWLQAAVVDGDLVRGKVSLSGDLADFSPANGKGLLVGEVDIVNGTMKFHPRWPVAKGMDGNLTFDAKSVRGRVYQGTIRDASFSDARLHIANFREPILDFQTSAIGPLDDMLDFAQQGPLADKIGGFFGGATGVGISRLALDLQVPLRRELSDRLRIDGKVMLENAKINARTFGLDLETVTGGIRFNRAGVQTSDLRARYLGVPVDIVAEQKSTVGRQINTIKVNGPMSVASVMHSYGIPLTGNFEGFSDWQVRLDVTRVGGSKKAQLELTATSDLSGTAIKLPTPLNKPSDTLLQAQVYKNFSVDENDWWVDLPGLVRSRIRVSKDRKLESMAIALGKSNNTVLPWRGVAIHGDVGRLDAPGWVDFALQLAELKEAQPAAEAFPLFAKVSARQMKVGSEDLGKAVYIAYRDGTHQVHRLENQFVKGELLRKDTGSDEPMVFQLDSLDKTLLTAIGNAKSGDGDMTGRPLDPRILPAMDVTVKKLKWDNWRFSRVSLRTKPEERGLEITALTARQNSLRISGNGRWEIYDSNGPVEHATTLDLNATFDNLGAAVESLGGGKTFAEGQGEVALSLGWPTAAYNPDLPKMSGQVFLSLRNGRILSVEPGAGRILGLFALQALPRRLTLDFRDLVQTGLEYTSLSGNFSIADGFATTRNLLLVGPVAEILVRGSTDFVSRKYDQTVDVLPRVSGALPLIGVLSGGPAAGVTALLADGLLKGLGVNLDELGRRQYTIGGSWEKPDWQPVKLPRASRDRTH